MKYYLFIFSLFLSYTPFLYCQESEVADSLVLANLVNKIEQAVWDGNYEEALKHALNARDISRETYGENHVEYGVSLNNLAFVYDAMSNYDKALSTYEESLEITEKTVGKEHAEYCFRTGNMASLLRLMGRTKEAYDLMKQTLECARNTVGEADFNYGIWLNNLGLICIDLGRFQEAQSVIQASIDHYERSEIDNPYEYTSRKNNLAMVYENLGQYSKVLPIYKEVLSITAEKWGKENVNYGVSLYNLAYHYQSVGQYNEALPSYIEAVGNLEGNLGKDHSYIGQVKAGLAMCYLQLSQINRANELIMEAISNQQKNLEPTHINHSISDNNLANIYQADQKYDLAEAKYLEAEKKIRKNQGKQNPDYGTNLNDLANLYIETQKYQKAINLLEETLAHTEKYRSREHSMYGEVLGDLGKAYHLAQKYDKALEYYQSSISHLETYLGDAHPSLGIRKLLLARLYGDLDMPQKAIPLILDAEKRIQSYLKTSFAVLSEQQRENFMEQVKYHFDFVNSFILDHHQSFPELGNLALDHALRFNGILLESGKQMIAQIRRSKDTTLVLDYENWLASQELFANQYSLQAEKRVFNLDSLEQEIEELEQKISLSSRYFDEFNSDISWEDIKVNLSENEAFISFFHFPYFRHGEMQYIQYGAIVVKPDLENPLFVSLFQEERLNRLLDTTIFDSKNYIQQVYTEALYEIIWQPLDSILKDVDHISYIPSGLLHKINLQSIPLDDENYLVDKFTWEHVSNGRYIVQREATESDLVKSAIIYGGIDYDIPENEILLGTSGGEDKVISNANLLSLERSESRGRIWYPIPKSFEELQIVDSIFKAKQIFTMNLSGTSAKEEYFKAMGNKFSAPDILHFAGHGFFFPNRGSENSRGNSLSGNSRFKFATNPLLRSGLICAGANYAWKQGEVLPNREDGILTAYEIAQLDLSDTRLAVLSACETGLGDIKGDEGVYGLQRAFKQSGVQYLLLSLWSIPDSDETVEFMETFYQKWFSGMTIREAFSQTQKGMREKYKDPYYWAGFILIE